MNDQNPKLIRKIINSFHEREISGRAKSDFHLWLLESKDYVAKNRAIRELWQNLSVIRSISCRRSLRHVKEKLGFVTQKKRMLQPARRLMRAAAVLIPLVFVAGGIFFYNMTEWMAFEVPYGETGHRSLADGTQVWLNAGSRLEYPAVFKGRQREVRLDGEAYFDVAPDAEKPFVVVSNNLHTTVKGTEFNVCAYNNQRSECVTVVSGEVSVALNGEEPHLLNPDEHLIHWIEEGTTDIKEADTVWATCWMKRGLALDNCTLDEIMWKLQRTYNLKVIIDQAQLADKTTYNIRFTNEEPLDYILDDVHSLVGLPYSLEGNILTVGSDTANAAELQAKSKRGNLKRRK